VSFVQTVNKLAVSVCMKQMYCYVFLYEVESKRYLPKLREIVLVSIRYYRIVASGMQATMSEYQLILIHRSLWEKQS